MNNNECNHGGVVALSFLIGAIAGATTALLFSPLSGKDTRGKIGDFSNDLKDKIGELPEHLKTQASPLVDRGKEMIEKGEHFVDDQKKILAAAYEAGKEAMKQEKEALAATMKSKK
ncbi:MAG: YtxH domain-containing protein [Proteobacteria bacterium]|nr:YtxH domain-containing protein [Pseudomonadota bacterium]MBU1715643.1 YtxH domain-containing protein [Pseudomonadota bacterium]